MMKRTHVAVGLAVTIPLIIQNPISFIGVLGSVTPDWDYIFGIKHRTITHSFLALGISTAIIFFFNKSISLIWCISYMTHLFLDGLTVTGVPLMYPSKKRYGFKLYKTRGAEDYYLQLLAIAFIVYVYLK